MTYFDFCFDKSTTAPANTPSQGKGSSSNHELSVAMFGSGSALQIFGDSIEDVVKDQNSKTWLAKRQVIQVPHLAKLLANNNSAKVWVILDSQKKTAVIQLKFFLQESWKVVPRIIVEDEVLIFERTL